MENFKNEGKKNKLGQQGENKFSNDI